MTRIHTAGEWKKMQPMANGHFYVQSGEQVICEVHSIRGKSLDIEGITEEQANANLIAAAPALLAACESMRAEITGFGDLKECISDDQKVMLDAAITAAKG